MIPVFTAYYDSSDSSEEILLTALKPTVNHNVTQSQLYAEMTNNFLGGVYKTTKSHEQSLNSDKMHAAWGTFVSVCGCVHVTEFAIFVLFWFVSCKHASDDSVCIYWKYFPTHTLR